MKWYSHRSYKQHVEDMKSFRDKNEMRRAYQDWAKVIANRFDRTYPRIGILDMTDLLQEGYVGFYKAWGKLNWKLIGSSPEEERIGMITNYLKISIKRHIQRAIAKDRDTIRIPEGYYLLNPYGNKSKWAKYNKERQTDIFLTRTFSSFFTVDFLDKADDGGNYLSDELNDLFDDILNRYVSILEKTIIKMFYGIDEANDQPKSQKEIAKWSYKSISNVQNIKHRALKKLQTEEVKTIIQNKLNSM